MLKRPHDDDLPFGGSLRATDDDGKLPPPSRPMEVARLFVEKECTLTDALTLFHWRGGWWCWDFSHWSEVEDRAIRSRLYKFTEHATYANGKADIDWAPNRNKIGNLLEALAAVCFLPDEFDQPCWLDGRSAGTVVAVENGLLDVASRRLLPHTPRYFNQTAVPFAFDANAPQPKRWIEFLDALWPDEVAAIDVLAEWFGYVISGRLDLHKILLMVGPTRGGKGAIARILGALVGHQNVAGPTLSSLGEDFGLAPLVNKSLAVIADARFTGRDSSKMVERLLSISGEDTLTVNRKYRDQWTGKLPSRVHIISNELPKLGDASTAIIGRIVLLPLSRSWLGKEDHDLEPALHAELAGILNWALDGLQRLTITNDNCFTRLPSVDEAITTLRDLASPVGAFVRERCEVGPTKEIGVDSLYAAYKTWAEDAGHTKLSRNLFGRDLRAAVPAIHKQRQRDDEGDRTHVYVGIDLCKGQR
jgi:putative DNA primase/helicase